MSSQNTVKNTLITNIKIIRITGEMKQFSQIEPLQNFVLQKKEEGKIIGFVPTMGALHDGHLSLVREMSILADITVVSIFVNPTQFNDSNDFQKYPRTIDDDLEMLKGEKVDVVFTPAEKEIYPKKDTPNFEFGQLEKVMEGEHRPGHFNGVAQVVSRLFDIVKPDKAIFGEKDFQQLAIIRKMVENLKYPVKIIGAPIIREADGLAMSSRNRRLNPSERKNAAGISRVLRESLEKSAEMPVHELEKWVIEKINKNNYLQVEYFQVVSQQTLQPVAGWQENCDKIGCIAAFCGDVRLIDNIKYSF